VEHDYKVVVIGSGFGGALTALAIARECVKRGKNEKVRILERGTWWTTPVSTVQDAEVATPVNPFALRIADNIIKEL
jgi:cation diffusion facilitator CzcD-associated flavoprotein CzcO